MAATPPSPFAGIKLTAETPVTSGVDQRLFSPSPTPQKKITDKPKEPRNLASKQGTNLGTLEPLNLGDHTANSRRVEEDFALKEVPYHNNTFAFTDAELEAIEDLKLALRRQHGLRGTKNDIVRCGIHTIVEDYRKHGDESIIAKRLKAR